jgi:Na+-driven multidrug efflux pump
VVQELAKVTRVITVAAVCLTIPLALMCAAVPLSLPHLLTADPQVAACMRLLAPIAAASILACTLDVACEGLLVRSFLDVTHI